MGSNNYDPYLMVDGDLATAWCEEAPGPGIGEWVEFGASTSQFVSGFRIFNGYGKSSDRYYRNNAIKTITVITDYEEMTFSLNHIFDYQDILFDQPIMTTKVKIRIDAVYVGTADDLDTLISEIGFF
jgi:hypothetical protein